VTDRTELKESKKWGTLNVINNLFKIYFELNNLRLCQNLIRAVEGPGFPKALDGQTVEGRSFTVPSMVRVPLWQARSSPPAPPLGAPGGSGLACIPRGRGQPTGRPATASGA
tara:strand:- start:360 stop:695 length:336 start_codon:yes stop_codon:yes gene_type:complete